MRIPTKATLRQQYGKKTVNGRVEASKSGPAIVPDDSPMLYAAPQGEKNFERVERIREVIQTQALPLAIQRLHQYLSVPFDNLLPSERKDLLKAIEITAKMSGITQPIKADAKKNNDLDSMELSEIYQLAYEEPDDELTDPEEDDTSELEI